MRRRRSTAPKKASLQNESPIQVHRWEDRQRSPIQLECERQLWAEGFRPVLWIDPPGQVRHNFGCEAECFAWILSGRARVTLSGSTVELTAGDRVFIPIGSGYTLENTGGSKLVWLVGLNAKPPSPSMGGFERYASVH